MGISLSNFFGEMLELTGVSQLTKNISSSGKSIYETTGILGSKQKTPKMPEMPKLPEAATETAEETIRKAQQQAQVATRQRQTAARRSQSIFTSPLGLTEEATTARKFLLGE